jgi:lysozyme family protein
VALSFEVFMDLYDRIFKTIVNVEGGFTKNPKDRGNWTSGVIGRGELKGTKYGISAMAYPHLDIKNLTVEQAKDIYYRDYWLKAGCHQLPADAALLLFDMAVNSGVGAALKNYAEANGDPDLFVAERLDFYAAIEPDEFNDGWMRRLAHVIRVAVELKKHSTFKVLVVHDKGKQTVQTRTFVASVDGKPISSGRKLDIRFL